MDGDEPRDHHILYLMVPMLIGGKDDFGKETAPPLPLLLDRVSEGQLTRSVASLFRIPSEVLGEIVQYLEPSSLASLALSNRDCRQLARSRQFASVLLDYSRTSISLIRKLLDEGYERVKSPNGVTSQPSIGACIRRITVATDPRWVSQRHGVILAREPANEDDGTAMRTERKQMSDASHLFFDKYLQELVRIFDRDHMPHLELLDCEDKIVMPRNFFDNIARSSIKHLKLFRVLLNEEFRVKLPNNLGPGGWPLQTLHLEVHWDVFGKERKGSTSPLCASILGLCAPTLSSLVWKNEIDHSLQSLTADSEDPLQFPCLRRLQISNIKFSNATSLNVLLAEDLISLMIDTEMTPIHSQCFKNRGTIRNLETFVWESFRIPENHPLDFLKANTQLSRLSLPYSAPPFLLEAKLLPLLASSFRNLSSLSLVWDGDEIRTSALEIIGTLKGLKQIHLSSGCQSGWRYDWLIDHNSMRSSLASLPHLKKVAFSRDSYDNESDWSDVDHYYVDTYFNYATVVLEDGESFGNRNSLTTVWERLHKERMLDEATKYLDTLPKLEWLYIGQLPMAVRESQEIRGTRYAVPLSAERDDCQTVLRQMFDGVAD